MIPGIALIRTEKSGYEFSRKICGLYPIERNIKILMKAGIEKIVLDLSEEEKSFYKAKLARRLEKIRDLKIASKEKTGISGSYLSIPSNLFTQVHYYKEFTKYFKRKGNIFKPVIKDDQFLLIDDSHFKNAVNFIKRFIIGNTGGFIAQKINKSISMPVSLLLVNTRIHPNYLTVINMIIGILSGILLLLNSYLYTVLGGFLFQFASIMDGVDGEVAKLSFRESKIGGWLDTISDNLTLVLFVSAASYLYFVNTGGLLSLLIIAIIFVGIAIMIVAMVRYLKRYSESGSLVAYDREFLQKLPQDDIFVYITQKVKYVLKKEFFSIVFFIVCLTGKVFLLIPIIAVILLFSSIVLVIIDIKYLKDFR